MIRNPMAGQRVRLHYRKAVASFMPHHGKHGIIVLSGRGPGPRNVLVWLYDGTSVNVPRGNLA